MEHDNHIIIGPKYTIDTNSVNGYPPRKHLVTSAEVKQLTISDGGG